MRSTAPTASTPTCAARSGVWSTGSCTANADRRSRSAVPFVDDAQSLKGEPGLEVLDRLGVRHDQLGQAAGGHDGGRPELRLEAAHDGVDLAAVAVDGTRLDRFDRR